MLFVSTDTIAKCDPERLADLFEFKDIEATIAGFIGADEGLRTFEAFRQIYLPQARLLAHLTEESLEFPESR